MQHRRQKLIEALAPDPPATYRKYCQDHQRNQHDRGAFVDPSMSMWRGRPRPRMVGMVQMFFPPTLSKKCQTPKPEHIERSQKRGEPADLPVLPTAIGAGESLKQNC